MAQDSIPAAIERRLGGMTAIFLVIANMIGTGVFTTTGFLIRDIPSPTAVLIGWIFGGLLALCGALSYAELTAALPKNGGEYQLLGRIYHPLLGFVAGFISLIVGFSAPIAASAIAFAKYTAAIFGLSAPQSLTAITLVIALSLMHAWHVRAGSNVQNIFTAAKVALIAIYILLGFVKGQGHHVFGVSTLHQPMVDSILSSPFAIGLIYISFSYSGWNGAAYLAGEIKSPERNLPFALIMGTTVVTVLYALLNYVFLTAAPAQELAGKVEIGHIAAVALFGQKAGDLLSGMIALALVSSVSAMVMAGPRVYQAMGDDNRVLHILNLRSTHGGPFNAIALQGIVAIVMILTSTFEVLLSYIGFTLSLFSGLTVLGVFVLRAKEPDLARPYRAWGYPFTPALFIILSLWMAGHILWQQPLVGLAGLGTIILGSVLYFAVLNGRKN